MEDTNALLTQNKVQIKSLNAGNGGLFLDALHYVWTTGTRYMLSASTSEAQHRSNSIDQRVCAVKQQQLRMLCLVEYASTDCVINYKATY